MIEFHGQFSHLALPELESRGIKLDFAFVDGSHLFDYVLVDFFYIDRMLRRGGVIAFDDADWPSIRKVCRFIVKNRSYSVFRCFPGTPCQFKRSLKSRILRRVGERSKRIRFLLNPEFLELDVELGVAPGARCIALRKESDDERHERPYNFHQIF